MSDPRFLPHSSVKLQQWEITKGHLRAMVALEGALPSVVGQTRNKFVKMDAFVEDFIKEFESNGYHWGID